MQKRSFFQKLTGSYPFEEESGSLGSKQKSNNTRTTKQEESTEEGQLGVDVYQTANAIILETMVAGVRPEDLDISITREMITVRGHRNDVRAVPEGDFFSRELYWGSFSRTIVLPQEVDPEEAEAIENHGLLKITLPKINREKVAKLKIRSS